MGRYPTPVVAAIGCGVQPGLAVFFGELHWLEVVLLLMVRFSARDASEASRSPVRTLEVAGSWTGAWTPPTGCIDPPACDGAKTSPKPADSRELNVWKNIKGIVKEGQRIKHRTKQALGRTKKQKNREKEIKESAGKHQWVLLRELCTLIKRLCAQIIAFLEDNFD